MGIETTTLWWAVRVSLIAPSMEPPPTGSGLDKEIANIDI